MYTQDEARAPRPEYRMSVEEFCAYIKTGALPAADSDCRLIAPDALWKSVVATAEARDASEGDLYGTEADLYAMPAASRDDLESVGTEIPAWFVKCVVGAVLEQSGHAHLANYGPNVSVLRDPDTRRPFTLFYCVIPHSRLSGSPYLGGE